MDVQGTRTSVEGDADALADVDQQAVIEALARSAVQDVAPEELPLFGPMSDAYFDPWRGTPAGASSDEMLGFGVDAASAMVLVTPVALEAAKSVLGYVIGELQTALKDEAKPMIQALAKRILHPHAKPGAAASAPGAPEAKAGEADSAAKATREEQADEPMPFTQDQIDEVHKVALRTAQRMGMERAQASLVADAIVGAMVS
jgi:hypothetical protein